MPVESLVSRLRRWAAGWPVCLLVLMPWRITTRQLRRHLTPRHRFGIRDTTVERVTTWMRFGALAIFWLVTIRWKRLDSAWLGSAISDKFNGLMLTAVVTAGMLVPPCALLVAVARRGHRRRRLAELAVPLRTLGGAILVVVCACLAVFQLPRVEAATESSSGGQVLLTLAVASGLVMFCVALVALLLVGGNLVVRHSLRAADGHPTLPALVTLTVHLVMLAVAGATAMSGNADTAVPYWLWLSLVLGAPMLVIGRAGWELHRLRTRWGVTLTWSPTDDPDH